MPRAGPRILIADDDPAIRLYLMKALKAEGYLVAEAPDSRTVLREVTGRPPDLLLLGLDLPTDFPDDDGTAFLREVRRDAPFPILALSGAGGGTVVAAALDHGADDVIAKPFSLGELNARVRNVLRRAARAQGKSLLFTAGALEVDLLRRQVRLQGRDVRLSPTEYAVLACLVEGNGRVLTHRAIMDSVWGPPPAGRLQSLRIAIRGLRHKIELDPKHPRLVLTMVRIGYRFDTSVHRTSARRHKTSVRVRT